ncbi:MAG TPA: Rieske 2Fe-2S domain-containing protein [Rhodocyclaceae bacterium]|nr:Rieske 2Fe-2S domain-containing protein [Rhodocyclaceae bacterium]
MRNTLICASSDLVEKGDGLRFVVSDQHGDWQAFVIRHEGKAYSFRNQCAHAAVELDWNPRKFFDDSGLYLICATHGALYEPATGECVDGPCRGAHLYAIAIEECDGNIYLRNNQ